MTPSHKASNVARVRNRMDRGCRGRKAVLTLHGYSNFYKIQTFRVLWCKAHVANDVALST